MIAHHRSLRRSDMAALRALPLGGRMLFLLLAEAAARSPRAGYVPFSDAARIALLMAAPAAEAAHHLAALLEAELVAIGDDGALSVPLLGYRPGRHAVCGVLRQAAARGRPPA